MANDTDLLTSNDNSDVSSSYRNVDRRQAPLSDLGMSSGAQNLSPGGSSPVSGEKLDSYVANGCVKLLEGSPEGQDTTKSLVCSATAICAEEEIGKFAPPTVVYADDPQHSTANGFVPPPTLDKRANKLTDNRDIHSQQSADVSWNSPAGHTSAKFPPETFSAESADKLDLGYSDDEQNANNSSNCACSLQPSELAANLADLSVDDDDSSNPRVPCDDSVAIKSDAKDSEVKYIVYESERQMEAIMQLITKDLSEPYSIYTYRYFIHNWPKLCYLAMDGDACIGAIVCKLDRHKGCMRRGYIAMLAVDHEYRKLGIGSSLVVKAIRSMMDPDNGGCDEVVLETEITNSAALHLYEKLGFVRDKRLFRYYLNGVDALRLKLWLK